MHQNLLVQMKSLKSPLEINWPLPPYRFSDLLTSLIWVGQSRSGLRALNWLWRWQRAKIPYLTPFFVKLKGEANISFTKSQIPTTKMSSVLNKLFSFLLHLLLNKKEQCFASTLHCMYLLYLQNLLWIERWGYFGRLYFRQCGSGICFPL